MNNLLLIAFLSSMLFGGLPHINMPQDQTPPSPVQVRLDGLVLSSDKSSYDLQLFVSSPDLVEYIKVVIWNTADGSKILELAYPDPRTQNVFEISTATLMNENQYDLRISAISRADGTAFQIGTQQYSGSSATEISHSFTFMGRQQPVLVVDAPQQTDNDLVFGVHVSNPEQIAAYSGWLVAEDRNMVAPGSNYSVSELSPQGTLRLELGQQTNFPAGKYVLVIRGLDDKGNELARFETEAFSYLPKHPGVFERISKGVASSPWIVAAILLIVAATVFFAVYTTSLQKRQASGIPSLSGKLAGNGLRQNKSHKEVAAHQMPINRDDNSSRSRQSPESVKISRGVAQDQAVLLCIRSGEVSNLTGKQFPISKVPFTVGRLDANLEINDRNISRKHFSIDYDRKRLSYTITDLGSRNGTRVSEKLIPTNQTVVLPPGAQIELGPNLIFRFDIR